MKKNKLFKHTIITVHTLSIIAVSATQLTFAESVSDNDITEIDTVSANLIIQDTNIDSLSHKKDVADQQRNDLIADDFQFIDVALPNNGTCATIRHLLDMNFRKPKGDIYAKTM